MQNDKVIPKKHRLTLQKRHGFNENDKRLSHQQLSVLQYDNKQLIQHSGQIDKKYEQKVILSKKYYIKQQNQTINNVNSLNKKAFQFPEIRGLHNIGNTCFINSIVQLLFSIPQLKTFLQKIHNHNQQQKSVIIGKNKRMIQILAQIFAYLDPQRMKHKNIDKLLEQLVIKLQLIDQGYIKYQQYDALQTFIVIFNQINDEDQHSRLYDLFQVKYSIKCRCCEHQLEIKTIILTYKQLSCGDCKQKYKIIFLNSPQYLIYSNSSPQIVEKKTVKDDDYDLVALIRYRGNGYYGHYKCIRKYDGSYYEFSDNVVRLINKIYQEKYYKNLILLYKKRRNIQQQTIMMKIKFNKSQFQLEERQSF